MDVLRQYFKIIHKYDEIKTTNNISFFNFRSEKVNQLIHRKVTKPSKTFNINGVTYFSGLELVCKKHFKSKKGRLYVNYTYILKDINPKDSSITIEEPVDGIEMTLDLKLLKDMFKLPYCSTCHSLQGLTKDENVTIFDCNTPYVGKKYIWTAITRARELKNVIIFEHSEKEIQNLTESRKKQYFTLKIENYKRQDLEAHRLIDKANYVTLDWFYEQLKQETKCSLCGMDYYVVLNDDNDVVCNITIDRINNEIDHSKDNCRLLCMECNRGRK